MQHVTGQCVTYKCLTSKASSLPCRPQVALPLPSVVIVQNVVNFVNTLRGHMLRRQPQHASSDTALARVGSADAAALVQQATALAARTLGCHSRGMPEPYSFKSASRAREHNQLCLLLLLQQKSLQPVSFLPLLSITLGKPLSTSLPPRGSAARTEQASCMPQILL